MLHPQVRLIGIVQPHTRLQQGRVLQVGSRRRHQLQPRYLPNTNILETSFVTATGSGVLIDFMPVHRHAVMPRQPLEVTNIQRVVRILHCTSGRLDFEMDCYPRFGYGTIVPHASLSSPSPGMAHGGSAPTPDRT